MADPDDELDANNPLWNHVGGLRIGAQELPLEIVVMDQDPSAPWEAEGASDDLLGEARGNLGKATCRRDVPGNKITPAVKMILKRLSVS